MELVEAVVLGTVQGLLEWLPVSSEGIASIVMMVLFNKGASEAAYTSIWLHLGTTIAAIVYFRNELQEVVGKLARGEKKDGLPVFLVVSTLLSLAVAAPIALVGLEWIDASYGMLFIGALLLVTGGLQIASNKGGQQRELAKGDGVVAGVLQGLSVLPGLSRSGLTTSALLLKGYRATHALKLSFLMSIPFILAGEAGLVLTERIVINAGSLVAVAVSFVFGIASIGALMRVAKRVNFGKFCMGLGSIAFLSFFL